jgi:hypothetical protein
LLTCWVLVQLPWLIYQGVLVAVNNWWGGSAEIKALELDKLARAAPGYSEAANEVTDIEVDE